MEEGFGCGVVEDDDVANVDVNVDLMVTVAVVDIPIEVVTVRLVEVVTVGLDEVVVVVVVQIGSPSCPVRVTSWKIMSPRLAGVAQPEPLFTSAWIAVPPKSYLVLYMSLLYSMIVPSLGALQDEVRHGPIW